MKPVLQLKYISPTAGTAINPKGGPAIVYHYTTAEPWDDDEDSDEPPSCCRCGAEAWYYYEADELTPVYCAAECVDVHMEYTG